MPHDLKQLSNPNRQPRHYRNHFVTMSPSTAQRVAAATKRRLKEVMKTQPEGKIPEVEDIEAWGKLFAAALVSGTVGERTRTSLTH